MHGGQSTCGSNRVSTTTKRYRSRLAEAVTDQNLEAVLLESLVESLDAASVEALCGEKHASWQR